MNKLEKRKKEILKQIQDDINLFLKEHLEEKYYCFAFDCNSEYAQILVCFNTEEDFTKTWEKYNYQTDEDYIEIRYNTGDWKYQGFAEYEVLTEDEMINLYGDDIDLNISEMMKFNYQLLELFCNTETFRAIPKTDDFKILCTDHDTDLVEALENTEKYVMWKK